LLITALLITLLVPALLFAALLITAALSLTLLILSLTLLPAAAHLLQLLPQFFDLAQRLLGELVALRVLAVLARAQHLLHLLQLVADLVHALRDRGLRHHAVLSDAAADPIGIALHLARHFGLLHLRQRLTQLGRRFALRILQVAHCGLHSLLEL